MELQFLKGVGPRRAEALTAAGIATVADLLYVLPSRYEDRRVVTPIREACEGPPVTCIGKVTLASFRRMRGRMSMLKVLVADASGVISCCFQSAVAGQHFRVGRRVVVYGPPRLGGTDST